MSQPTTYEQLIAQKLEELVVPDHANAIWATIEQQLNIEMPTGGNSSGGSGFNNPNWWIGGGGFFTIIVAVFMYVVISKQNLRNKPESEKPEIINQQPVIDQDFDTLKNVKPSVVLKGAPAAPSKSPGQKVQETEAQASGQTLDTAVSQKSNNTNAVMQQTPTDTIPAKRKPRGMRGITDADYRIVPKKDTE